MNLDYKYITANRVELEKYKLCLCLDCFSEYDFNHIGDWCDDGQTAICPYCWNDATLPSPNVTDQYSVDDVKRWHQGFLNPCKRDDMVYIDKPGCYFNEV